MVIFLLLGLQIWQDGSQYNGDFVNDKRHGEGEVKWSNNEVGYLCSEIFGILHTCIGLQH